MDALITQLQITEIFLLLSVTANAALIAIMVMERSHKSEF